MTEDRGASYGAIHASRKPENVPESWGDRLIRLIDAIQRTGYAEELQRIPDVRISIKLRDGLGTGLSLALPRGLALASIFQFYEIVSFFVYLLTGGGIWSYIVAGIFLLIGALVAYYPAVHMGFVAVFVSEYIKGPRSKEIWDWFVGGMLIGLFGGFFLIGMFFSLVFTILTDVIFSNTQLLNSVLSFLYSIIWSDEIKLRLYEFVKELHERTKAPFGFALAFAKDVLILLVLSFLSLIPYVFIYRFVAKRAAGTQGVRLGPERRRIFN